MKVEKSPWEDGVAGEVAYGLSHNFASESEYSSASSNFEVYTRLHNT
jgi:hypothetical protein